MSEFTVGRVEDLPEGRGTTVRAGRRYVAVFRVGANVFALPDRCQHKGASLGRGKVICRGGGASVRCPWHSWDWDLASGRLQAYAGKHAAPVDVRVVDGEVRLSLP